jgi:hypothetical protein
MSAFLKTLFGDTGTVAVVAIVMAAEVFLTASGHAAAAAFVVPVLVLAGTASLATSAGEQAVLLALRLISGRKFSAR